MKVVISEDPNEHSMLPTVLGTYMDDHGVHATIIGQNSYTFSLWEEITHDEYRKL